MPRMSASAHTDDKGRAVRFDRTPHLPPTPAPEPAVARTSATSVRARATALCGAAFVLCLPLAFVACGGDDSELEVVPAPRVRSVSTLEPLDLGGIAPASGPGGAPALATWTVPAPGGGEGDEPADLAPFLQPLSQAGIPRPTPAPTLVPGAVPPLVDPEIIALQERVSADRLRSDVRRLAGFGTRHVHSTGDDERGIDAAAQWLFEEFGRISAGSTGQFTVENEDFDLDWSGRVTRQRNVIGTLTGIGERKRLIYVIAHYDSRTDDLNDGVSDAPGADDNASGTAALLELARVLGRRRWDASVRLIAFAANEPGLYGSRSHAPRARDVGLPIEAVLNNDIIGGGADQDGASPTGAVRMFSADPEDGPSRQLARWAAVIASRYGGLEALIQPAVDRDGRESDHKAFSDLGFPAIRIVSAVEHLSVHRTSSDTADRLDEDYHADVVRLNVALAATLALAPPPPAAAPTAADSAEGAGDLHVQWPPTADLGVAGHWVGVRSIGAPTFALVRWAGAQNAIVIGANERPQGPIAVSLAASDGRGHMGLFGPELRID